MIARPSHRRFIVTLLVAALTLVAIGVTGFGGLPLFAVASIVVLGTVDVCFRSFDTRHRAATVPARTGSNADYEMA